MASIKKIEIKEANFLFGYIEGLELKNNKLVLKENAKYGVYISKPQDSAEKHTEWGRVVLNGAITHESEYITYAFALDNDKIIYKDVEYNLYEFIISSKISASEKINILKLNNAQINYNTEDILLFKQRGRYLVLAIQIFSDMSLELNSISIIFPKEMLLQYFPEIYSSDNSDFFSRYMAIYNTLLYDKKEIIEKLPDYIDIDKTPDDVLPILAKWLGLNFNIEIFNPYQVRKLLKNIKYISEYKGTKNVLEEIIAIYLNERPIIIEQFKWKKYSGVQQQSNCKYIYGKNDNEFTILIKQTLNETKYLQLKSLINMFTPIKAKAKIVFLDKDSQFNNYVYFDLNAKLVEKPRELLCENQALDAVALA